MANKYTIKSEPKEKVTGVLLAVLFGVFAYLYMWKFKKIEFIVTGLIALFLFWTVLVPVIIWIAVIVDMAMLDRDKYVNYLKYKVE